MAFDIPTSSLPSPKELAEEYVFLITLVKHFKEKKTQENKVQALAIEAVYGEGAGVWNREIERELCELYLTRKRLALVREELNIRCATIYGKQFKRYTDAVIKNKFERVLRMAIKKI